ncbi:hypothetical protein [Succinimonas sp.]|uniref:hypothetical protein n=1 Tax=Succinimonas sp. TaxID=1936151 RepID=UPI00386F1752
MEDNDREDQMDDIDPETPDNSEIADNPGPSDNSQEPENRNAASETAPHSSGIGINLKKAPGASDTGSGAGTSSGADPHAQSAAGTDPENPCDRELFFEKRISLFNLIVFSPLIITIVHFVYTALIYIICATGLGTNGEGYVGFLNIAFLLVVLSGIHLFIAWLIGRDVKRSHSPLKNSFFARPVLRYVFFLPLVCFVSSWFYIMAYGICKIAKTGPGRFYKWQITKKVPIFITLVSYAIFITVDAVEIPKNDANVIDEIAPCIDWEAEEDCGRRRALQMNWQIIKENTDCRSAQDCLQFGNKVTDLDGNCENSFGAYKKACNVYKSGKGCFDAGMCLLLDRKDKFRAEQYLRRACDRGISFSCKLIK